ncbi:phosphotransferase [Streptomyces anulatus]|uniref:maltokinase N-terminal cap-like domain-containing protein n=1 Tax=Streptomyces TaxID=1883 RepID=UPI0006DB09C1|nr:MULTISPECIES: phosphotransferase [Streptomyces]MDF9806752.1 maltokinase [Streptomyces sp. HB372]KPL32630.1 maltokinase [Streptomyces anulatus]OKI82057.1 maltokinase [Streptomyces sp. TSRI0395]WSC64223.1 phosphotransferase [Streptomyces anulatus]WSR78588.1 phosphotransferase [Streptomyces anulatus]
MSEAASTHVALAKSTRNSATPSSTQDGTLLPSLAPLLHAWLPRQRWFAGKGRPVTGFSLVSATEMLPLDGAAGPGLLHLLLRVEQPSQQDRPADDCYQLLLGARTSLPPLLAGALIGRVERGPLAGRVVYDALHDPRLADVLLERFRRPGSLGSLRFERTAAIPAGLTPRVLDAEQSNSSLVYGDAFILKIFRRVFPGTNPDLELPLALGGEGCERVPAPVAWFEAPGPEPLTLGVLQPFLHGARDGWQLALAALAAGRDFLPEARALGRATAEVHTALAAALPTPALRGTQTRQLVAEMTRRLEAAAQAVPALVPHVPGLRAAFEAVTDLGVRGSGWAQQRVHGDLHLGQTLRSADGFWSLIDFEGEPARPLPERRMPAPPVRDVAGMLRSFDYAARSHRPWNPEWAARCRAAYCEGYAQASGRDPRGEPELLRAHETDKAVYEVLYEARHRPDWLPVPMAAIQRLARSAAA